MVLTAKLYQIVLSFRFLTHSLLRGLRWAVLRAWTQNHPKVVGTCPGHHPQPIGRNRAFEIERPEPPLKWVCTVESVSVRIGSRHVLYPVGL